MSCHLCKCITSCFFPLRLYCALFRISILPLCCILLFVSCKPGYKPVWEITPGFQQLLDTADQNRPTYNKSAFRNLGLDSVFRHTKDLSFKDSFEYYRFCYNFLTNNMGEDSLALIYTDSMLLLLDAPYHAANDEAKRYKALVYYLRGDSYYSKVQYAEAYQQYFYARMLGQELLDLCTLSDYSYRLGMVLYNQERYQESLLYFQESLNRLKQCNNMDFLRHYFAQEVISNIALCYSQLALSDSAMYFYYQALDYQDQNLKTNQPRRKQLNQAAKAVVLGNLAAEYEHKEQFDKAEQLYKESIATNINFGRETIHAIKTNMMLARMYFQTGELDKMYQTLTFSRQHMNADTKAYIWVWWEYYMARYYEASGSPAKAYAYLSTYVKLKDSINKMSLSLRQSDVKEHLKNIEKEQDIIVLERNNARNQWYLVITSTLVIGSVIAVLFIVYYTRRMRRYMGMLAKANKRIKNQKITLTKTLGKLESSNQEKDRILRVVAHDLRSPVAAIHALADITLQDTALSQENTAYIRLIKTASDQALTLSREILDTAVLMNNITLSKEPVEVTGAVNQYIELLRFRAAEKKQQIVFNQPADPVIVQLDKEKFGRVINNLVTNAIKFSSEQTVIDIRLERASNSILLSVTDSGIGIPETIKDKIFDTFTIAKRVGTGGEKPFGLGLSISRQIIEAHGGSIWFDSTEAKGTTFYLSLPLE